MKLTICGSMDFARKMLEAKDALERMGHVIEIPCDTHVIASGNHNHKDPEANFRHCVENDVVMDHFRLIADSDGILVLNYPKNGIHGYVGGSSLMEIGLAYYLGKKIFMLFPPPSLEQQKYTDEIKLMNPVVLDGDLSGIR